MYNYNTSYQSYHGQQFDSPMGQSNSYKTESFDNQYMDEQTQGYKMSLNTAPFEPTDMNSSEYAQFNSLNAQVDEYFASKSYLTSKHKSQVHTPGKAFRSQDLNEDVSEGASCNAPTKSQTCSENHSDHEHCETHSSVCCDSHSEYSHDEPKKANALRVEATPFIFTPTEAPATKPSESNLNDLDINFDADFTPSTPYVHKFRTEMCKNFELYGKCKYGDQVSISLLYFFFLDFCQKAG